MTRWHNIYLDNHAHFCTYAVKGWKPALNEPAIGVLYDQWRRNCERFSVKVLAYVVMPDHVHMVIWAERADDIVRFLQRVIGQTSKRLKPGVGGFWKERPRVLPLYSGQLLREKVSYIDANPVRRGLVEAPDEWLHSSYGQIELGVRVSPFECAAIDC